MCHRGSASETRGGVSIRGLWERQTAVIICVRFGDADVDTWKTVRIDKLLAGWEKTKKEKYGQECYNQKEKILCFSFQCMG